MQSMTVNGSNVHLVWMDDRDSPLNNQEIYYKRSTDAGSTWEPDTRLTFDPYASNFPSVAVNGLDVHVVWMDTRNGVYSIFYKRSSDGGMTWGADTLLANTSNIMDAPRPSVAVSGQDVHVVWRDGGIIYKRSTDRGANWLPDTSLANSVFLLDNPSIATSGPYVHVVWDGELVRNVEIYYKRSTDAGSTWEPDTRLTDDTASSAIPSVAVSHSLVHVVWIDRRDGNLEVYYKRNPTGNSGVEESFSSFYPLTSNLSFSVVPNPFTSFTSVPSHPSERFALYDVSGRKVGVYKGDRIGEGLSAGVYFLKPFGGNAKPIRIVKLR
jgi:Neuraminidase (sialidase)